MSEDTNTADTAEETAKPAEGATTEGAAEGSTTTPAGEEQQAVQVTFCGLQR